jgi:predicted hotdog family 3-hydroxylacyl-ACP dehydratase
MSFNIQNATELIPQKAPFVLVDKLLYADENTSRASFKIPEGNMFVKDGVYTTAGMVESMAQTAAAGTGYLYRQRNREVPIGYILQVSLVSGLVKHQGNVIATCEMKIFISNQS